MISQQIDFERVIGIFIVNGVVILFFLIIFIKLWRRQKNRYSMLFSMVYLFNAIGLGLNIIYAFLTSEIPIITLDFFMMYLTLMGQIFALLFNLNLLKSITTLTAKKQKLIFIGYAIALFLALYFPMDTTINAEFIPRYSWTKFLVMILFYFGAFFIPIVYTIMLVYKTIETKELKTRWLFYLYGYLFLGFALANGFLYATWDNEIYRSFSIYFLLISTIIGGYLLYYGVGKSLKGK